MKTEHRKAAIAAYKERKSSSGVFAIRCAATGQVWVGQTLSPDSIQNRIWFTLRQGGHGNRELQAAWSASGGTGLSFELLERLDEEESAYVRDSLLKERAGHWRATLEAGTI
jgi:hypothetical protein